MPKLPLVVCCVLIPSLAFANGGPAAWTKDTPGGSITPVREPHIRLISEDLHIRVEDDGFYRVEAKYLLNNAEGPRKVLFGVPVRPEDPKLVHAWDEEERQDAGPAPIDTKACESVMLEVADRPATVNWKAARLGTDAWCAAEVEVPTGNDVTLVLRYRGELDFADEVYSKSALTVFSERTLKYQLAPAGFWAGPAQTVSIVVDGGPWSPFMEVEKPIGGKIDRGVVTWTFKNVDLSKQRPLVVRFKVIGLLGQRETLELGRKVPVTLAAKASSTLDDKRYPPANLVDGNPATAWCSSKKDGTAPWFEVSIATRKQEDEKKSFESFYILPGYTKDQRTWRSNARVMKLRVTPCGAQQPSFVIDVPRRERFEEAAFALHVSDDTLSSVIGKSFSKSPPNGPDGCVRVTLLAVEPGADICVSEFGYFQQQW